MLMAALHETMNVSIVLPAHCSSLADLSHDIMRGRRKEAVASDWIPETTEVKGDDKTAKQYDVVMVHCLDPAVAWRGLHPLFFQSPRFILKRALVILLRKAFGPVGESSVLHGLATLAKATDGIDNCSWYRRDVHGVKVSTTRGCPTEARRVFVMVLPPSTIQPGMHPERIFTSALVRWENLYIQMQTLSAYFATLGGGYFLCRYLSTAVRLAQRQRYICMAMGDNEAVDRCTINEAYNYVSTHFLIHVCCVGVFF